MAIQKKVLQLNGSERMLLCDPESDTLADVVRRLGLTGTKVGCGSGQCGACSVILDGKLIRSCTRKMKTIKDYSCVTTIEGLGTAQALHPLQLAWLVHGGVQCGFCTPGFIVSAKALLDSNPNPTRQDVREWFQKHRNACRCTGYKQLVDAVMAAAKVLRGEMAMEDLAWKIPENGRIYNTYIPRPTALAKVLGACDYGNDIAQKMPDVLYLAVVQPGVSHANIKGIDISAAVSAPGVVKVITSADVKGNNRISLPVASPRSKTVGQERPILMDQKIFRYGDVVALVAADTPQHARQAAKLVKLDLEPLPEYLDALDAMADDAIEVHPGIPNVFLQHPIYKGKDTREVLAETDYVVEGSFYSTREPHLTIEPDVAQAYIDISGVLVIHCKSLALSVIIDSISKGIGMAPKQIRIVGNPTGASFGYSFSPGVYAMCAVATMATGRPVSLTMSYEEHMHYTGKRAAAYSNARMGCNKDGRLTAAEFEIAFDKGAYSELAVGLIRIGLRFFGAPYYIPNVMGLSKATFSNHAFSTSYRGFGSPQTYTASESLMDMLAEKAGMDPLEFRYINVCRPGDTSNAGHTYDVYPMQEILDRLRPKYQALRERALKEGTAEKRCGVGVCCGSYNVTTGASDHAEVALELNPDGSVTSFNTWEEQGQGADVGTLVLTHEALRPIGLRPDQIRLVQNDTGICPDTGPAAGSRSHYMAGNALIDAANKLMEGMKKEDGSYRSYTEMIAERIPTKYIGIHDTSGKTSDLDSNTGKGNPTPEFTYCAYVSEVEVEVSTGKARVKAMHCVADVGVVGNYLAVDGQAYGGMMHSVGFALTEDYSDVKKHTNLIGAGFPYIEMIPDGDDFTVEYVETPRPSGPHGSSGASEAFQSSDHVAILNAIYDAVGVRICSLPATPEKILKEIQQKDKKIAGTPPRYYLGGDFYEIIDDMRLNPLK